MIESAGRRRPRSLLRRSTPSDHRSVPAGHQPMSDEPRGTTIVFNGMIYNFRELRRELEAGGMTFTSDCDTEVVLKAYELPRARCVEKLRGMFAFAIWDPRERDASFLARDRLGIKPLYYCHDGRRFPVRFAGQSTPCVRPRRPTTRSGGRRNLPRIRRRQRSPDDHRRRSALPAGYTATSATATSIAPVLGAADHAADRGLTRRGCRRPSRDCSMRPSAVIS